ncbi:MAG: hypothetical protein HY565_03310 [Candidatus Kerfeldbacteria bacterium]|nr:hypothetical protein [Candidatus Kerfeldbacteria bacterium]
MTEPVSAIERQPTEPTPLEEHLWKRYAPVVQTVERWLGDIRERSTTTGSVSQHVYEDTMDEALNPTVSLDDLTATAEVLQRHNIVQVSEQGVTLAPDTRLSSTLQEELALAVIKCVDLPKDCTVLEAIAQLHDCRLHNLGNDTVTVRADTKQRGLLRLLDAAGLIQIESVRNGDVTVQLPRMKGLDSASEELAVFSILALHQSESAAGLTTGWNKVLVPADVVYGNVAAMATEKPDKALYITGLANRGFLMEAGVAVGPRRQSEFFFNVDHRQGKAFRQDPRYTQWVAEHRVNETNIKERAAAAFKDPAAMADPLFPDNIRIITQADLERLLDIKRSTELQTVTHLGYALLAVDPSRFIFKAHGSEVRKQRRHYFIGSDLAALQAWKDSPKYQQWMDEDKMRSWMLEQWNKQMQASATVRADLIPAEQQPAYLVTADDIAQPNTMELDPHHLSALGCIMLLHGDTYVYWPDRQQGLAYKRAMQGQFAKPTELKRHLERSFYETQIKKCFARPDWPAPPAYIKLPDAFPDIRIVSYDQLEQLVHGLEPLSIGALKRKGYVIDAQTSTARPGIGLLIACPGGPAQADRVRQSTWYAEQQAAQRQRGFDQLMLSTKRQRAHI